ncbi:MAG: carbohydrate porin [Deltaproteobacteria bacterium]|nr:carbohydrate porin [Deltaproteobacteria bacterium]
MKKQFLLFTTAVVLFLFCPPAATADEVRDELRLLKQRIEQLEKKLSEQDGRLVIQDEKISAQSTTLEEVKKVKDAIGNLEFSVGATSIIQGTINNDSNASELLGLDDGDDTDASYSFNIEISSKLGDNGLALVMLEGGEGNGSEAEAGGLTYANWDATFDDADLSISEIWYQHELFDDKVQLTVGKMDPWRWWDHNEVANDETAQFLSGSLVQNVVIDFPDSWYSYGARLGYYPNELIEINLGFLESNGDFEDIFDDNFMIAEVWFKPKFGDKQGNYRFYVWRNTGDHAKLRRPDRNDESAEGFGVSFDQQLSDSITAFLRYGQHNEDVSAVERALSCGFQIAGSKWGRDDDMIGFGYTHAYTSEAYRDTLRDVGLGPAAAEQRFETYYRFKCNDYLDITPDVQIVRGILGVDNGDSDTAAIVGVRAQLAF